MTRDLRAAAVEESSPARGCAASCNQQRLYIHRTTPYNIVTILNIIVKATHSKPQHRKTEHDASAANMSSATMRTIQRGRSVKWQRSHINVGLNAHTKRIFAIVIESGHGSQWMDGVGVVGWLAGWFERECHDFYEGS